MSPELANMIIEYEEGNMSISNTIKLFSLLIQSGLAWRLQGFYGRMATRLIECGYITEDGEITELSEEYLHKEN